jgi:hypothetical protein
LCPAVTLSHPDGHQSAVALLLKAALIQVSDYRLLGASGFWRFSRPRGGVHYATLMRVLLFLIYSSKCMKNNFF